MSVRIPAETFPPGEFIRDELDSRGWTQTDLAEILGRPFRLVNEILSGKRAITPETAQGLGDAFGTDPRFWMNLEGAYRLSLVAREDEGVARRARLYGMAPIKEMVKRKWIEPTDNFHLLEERVLRFFGVKSVDEKPSFLAAARKSASYTETTPEQLAWLCRAKQLATTLSVSPFDNRRLEASFAELHKLTSSEKEARRISRALADLGIRLVIIEHLPKTRIDGAAFWLDERSPVVAVSLRFDRIDGFWFTLAHELAHIKNNDGLKLDDDLVGEDAPRPGDHRPESETLADEFASEFLIPKKEIDSFIARVRPLYSTKRIIGFANRIQVHPGIIIGQLQRRGEIKYSQGRELLAKVRDVVTQSALTDGWGNYPLDL